MIEGFKVGDRVRVTDEGMVNLGFTVYAEGTVLHDALNDIPVKTCRVVFDGRAKEGWVVYSGEIEHADQPDAITPDHYKFGNVQVIDIIKYLPFNEGNVIKYVARADRKGNKLEDLRKAQKYLNLAIEIAEEEDGRNPSLS